MNFVALIEYKSAESFIIAIKIVLFTKRLFSSFSCFISWNLYAFFTILIYAYMSIIVVNHNYYWDVFQAIFFFKYFITIPTIVCLCLFLEDVKNTKLNCFYLKVQWHWVLRILYKSINFNLLLCIVINRKYYLYLNINSLLKINLNDFS